MSQNPLRLLDDPSLPDALREDLAEAAGQPLPPVDMAAGLASLKASIGASASAGASAGAAAEAAALAHGSWWGGALIGLGAGLVGAAAIWLAPPLAHSPEPPPSSRVEVSAATTTPTASPAPTLRSTPAPTSAAAAAQVSSAAPRAPLAVSAPSASASAPPEITDGPSQELALLVRIKQSAASDPALAVALVDEGHRRFPRGSFYQERESIAVLALAQLGRTNEARARAKHFLDAHSESPYAERLRSIADPP